MSSQYDQAFNVIAVGSVEVGKSELVRALTAYDYRFNIKYHHTIAVDFSSVIIEHDDYISKIQFLNTAGDDRFYSIVPSYYQKAIVILLCFDYINKESLDALDAHIKRIKEHVGSPSFILVGTKFDLSQEIDVTQTDIKNFIAKHSELEIIQTQPTSAKQKEGIDELMKTVGQCATKTIEGEEEEIEDSTQSEKSKIDEMMEFAIKHPALIAGVVGALVCAAVLITVGTMGIGGVGIVAGAGAITAGVGAKIGLSAAASAITATALTGTTAGLVSFGLTFFGLKVAEKISSEKQDESISDFFQLAKG